LKVKFHAHVTLEIWKK